MSISKIVIPNSLCVFSQIKDRKHIEQNFHSVARVIAPGWDLWVLGGQTLAWGFAVEPHRLRALVSFEVLWFQTINLYNPSIFRLNIIASRSLLNER